MNANSGSGSGIGLDDALALFRRLGVHVEILSRAEFSAAYLRLARRYHPDVNPNTQELMANINAARKTVLESFRRIVTLLLPIGLAAELFL